MVWAPERDDGKRIWSAADPATDVAVRSCRQAVVKRAESRAGELLEEIFATLAQLPEYGHGRSRGELEDIRNGVGRSIELCLWTIGEGRRLDTDELMVLHLTGGQRARQGVPKPVVLAGVRLATRIGRAFLITCGDVCDDAEVLMGAFREISGILDRFEDDACAALADGHDEAYGRVLSAADRGEAVLVDRLLERRFHDDEDVLAHAAEVGLLPGTEARVVVVAAACGPADERRLRAAAGELRSLVRLAVGPVRLARSVHLPLVIQPSGTRTWDDLLGMLECVGREHEVVLVHADRPARLTSMWPGYRAIHDYLPFLPAATGQPGCVSSLILRFHHALFAGGATERMDLLQDVFGPFAEVPEREAAELFETLDALYETGGSAASLARRLHRHKNTIGNRLRRVRELTGLDMRHPPERLVLETLLRLRRVTDVEWNAPSRGRSTDRTHGLRQSVM